MTAEEIIQKYPYAYEGHMHTSEGSQCGQCTGEVMAKAYKAAGYAGIIITDHHIGGNTRPDRSLPWDEWVSEFFGGYRNAKKTGDEIGLTVFCGWESGFCGTEFLIYGLGEEWMKQHPELRSCTVKQQYELVHNAGGAVFQAHPFRQRSYIPEIRLFPDYVDGVEGINAKHANPSTEAWDDANEDLLSNPRAFEYAARHNFPTTCGSDMHTTDIYVGTDGKHLAGMHFEKPLKTESELIKALLSHGKTNDYVLCDGHHFFGKFGEKLD